MEQPNPHARPDFVQVPIDSPAALEEILDTIGNPADVVLALAVIARRKAEEAKAAGNGSLKVAWNWQAVELEDAATRLRKLAQPRI